MTGRDWILVLIPAAYLMGSIPWGLIVGLSKGVDPRKAGSGNIGATNVGRLLGGKYFALVFVLDMLKGMVPMLLAGAALRKVEMAREDYLWWLAVGAAAIGGHMFSVFLKFKGGKGVATSAGVALGLWPYYTWPGLVGLVVWIVLFKATRYVSVASIVAAVVFPVAYVVIGEVRGWRPFGEQLWLLVFAVLIAGMIVVRHRTNIKRLMEGTENRFGPKREKATTAEPSVEEVNAEMSRFAEDAVRWGSEKGLTMDFTAGSVERVERMLAELHVKRVAGALADDQVNKAALRYGAYVGEVIRRMQGGSWGFDHDAGGPGSFPLLWGGGASFPIGWCGKRIVNGEEDNVWIKFQMLVMKEGMEGVTFSPDDPADDEKE